MTPEKSEIIRDTAERIAKMIEESDPAMANHIRRKYKTDERTGYVVVPESAISPVRGPGAD
jgi:hypothetical protein